MRSMTRVGHSRWWLLVVGALILAACGGGASPAADSPAPNGDGTNAAGDSTALEKTDISMRFQWIPQWQFAGYIVAEANGYYDDVGLNVTLNGGGPDFPTKQLVASGSDDFGTSWVDSMYLSEQRGVPLMALATFFQDSPTVYMVHADSGIETPADFAGKTVAVYYGGGEETEFMAMLREVGLDREEVNEVPGEFSLEPFFQRRIDVLPVYATDQPNIARSQGYDVHLIDARDYGVVMMGDVLFSTREFIEQHPNTTRAFVQATLRGWNWAAENPEEAVDIILEFNPELDRDQLLFEAEETIKLLRYGAGERCIGWSDRTAWETEEQMLLDLGILEEPTPYEDVANNTYVAEYYEEQGVDCTASAAQ